MNAQKQQLTRFLRCLSDGRPHPWSTLDQITGSRGAALAACKTIASLGARLNWDEDGAHLQNAFEPLDESAICLRLQQNQVLPVPLVSVYLSVGSTNEKLAGLDKSQRIHGMTYLAEHQSAGKGRAGRSWLTPMGGQVAMSVCLRFASDVRLEGLSLAVGVCVARALQDHEFAGARLKWPNDVLLNGRKLAGILIQVVPEATHSDVIVGMGLNYALGTAGSGIDQPWSDLSSAGVPCVSRNVLAADLIGAFLKMADRFTEHGYQFYKRDWELLNAHRGKPVLLSVGRKQYRGTLTGTDESGAAVVMTDQGRQVFHAGEVSLRSG